jgi:tRNA threonylcarbamoyladenosine biosynthesis protein TsaE
MVHQPILETNQVLWQSENDCALCARALAHCPAILEASLDLRGALGAGKTTLARHLLRQLGITGTIKSPTYAILEPYTIEFQGGTMAISHFDFYRLQDPQEWEDAGFRDIFAQPGLKLCEWTEKAHGLIPTPDLTLDIQALDQPEQRQVTLHAHTQRGLALLKAAPQA